MGYVLIVLLIGSIAYTWHREWQEVKQLEEDNRQMDGFRTEINEVHIRLIEFSLAGETILDWDDEDLDHYYLQRMAIDSMLCNFKKTYPAERIDSVRYLLEDKERQMCQIGCISKISILLWLLAPIGNMHLYRKHVMMIIPVIAAIITYAYDAFAFSLVVSPPPPVDIV